MIKLFELIGCHLVSVSSFLLNYIFNINSVAVGGDLFLPNNFTINMDSGCSGLQQFYLVLLLFLIIPGPIKMKIWYIPVGLIIVHISNIIRLTFLVLITHYDSDSFYFVHDWVFRPFIYGIIFLLWLYWEIQIRKNFVSD